MVNYPDPGQKNLRKGRKSASDTTYFITFNTYRNRKTLNGEIQFKLVKEKLFWLEEHEYAYIYCFILMPNHIHVVLRLTGTKSLSEVMNNIKGYLSKQFKKAALVNERLWQPSYFDHRIRRNERFMQIIYYCYSNPYKSGLVKDECSYPWWYCKYDLWDELQREIHYFKKLEDSGRGFNPYKY